MQSLAFQGSDLYVGGFFNQTADGAVKDLNSIAKFSAGTWSALPNKGFDNHFVLQCCPVWKLTVNGNDVYAGGIFSDTADGAIANMDGIAKLSGGAWSALPHDGLCPLRTNRVCSVSALAPFGSDLYVGGIFSHTADGGVQNLNSIARFGIGAWSALPNNGLGGFHYSAVDAMAVHGADLYVGGLFTRTADSAVQNLNFVAKYSGGAWAPLPDNGLNGSVAVLAFNGNDLYVGGLFNGTAYGLVHGLNNIAVLSLPAIPNFPGFLPLVRR